MPRIFLTNDDGIESDGLAPLADELSIAGDVVVGAPDREMSGTGTAINVPGEPSREIRIEPRDIGAGEQVEVSAVSGTPALTVFLAHREVFGPRPDIVVSGPNYGANTGRDVHHSGTVGAAIAAARNGLPAVAVSVAVSGADPNWLTAARISATLVAVIHAADMRTPLVANLNVPDRPLEELRGIRTVGLASDSGFVLAGFDEQQHSGGRRLLKPRIAANAMPADIDSDIGALRAGYATLTWLRIPGLSDVGHDDLRMLHLRTSDAVGLPAA